MHVAIVGAGPAGTALSLLLARNGIKVTLLERETDFDRAFRGEALMPTGLEALDQMKLREQLDACPWTLLEAWQIHLERQLIMDIREPSRELGDRALRAVAQPQLLEAIVAECEKHPSFRLRRGTTVRGLLGEGGRTSGVRVESADGEETLAADLVVGADGRASVVRKRAGIELDLLPEAYDVVWLKVALPAELEGKHPIQIFASGPDACLAYPSWDRRWQIAWLIEKGSWREVRRRDWLAECAALMPASLGEHLVAQRDAVDGPSPLDVIVGRCARWHAPGLLLLGDAAHPMSPIRAQGINMALRDAIVAANHLVPALRAGGDVESACAALQAEREREIKKVQKLQWQETRGQVWARKRPWLLAPLLRIAPLLARTGFVQWAWLRQQRPLRFGVTEVTLSV